MVKVWAGEIVQGEILLGKMLNSEIYIEEKLSKIARIYNLLEKFGQKVEIFEEDSRVSYAQE